MTPPRSPRMLGIVLLAGVAAAGCDDQLKYVPFFSFMDKQPSMEAYEEAPRGPVPGAVPVDAEPTYSLVEADAALANPLGGSDEDLEHGERLYGQFCTPCHGPGGAGDGSVVGPNRIPPLPLLDLRTARARGYSDGYLWGMITNGRGLMPSYRRIPAQDRWYVVSWVRELQRRGAGQSPEDAGVASPDTTADADPDGSPAGASAAGGN